MHVRMSMPSNTKHPLRMFCVFPSHCSRHYPTLPGPGWVQVPSALKGLTAVFGMGTGVTPSAKHREHWDGRRKSRIVEPLGIDVRVSRYALRARRYTFRVSTMTTPSTPPVFVGVAQDTDRQSYVQGIFSAQVHVFHFSPFEWNGRNAMRCDGLERAPCETY